MSNISNHKWYDPDIDQARVNYRGHLSFRIDDDSLLINKDDAIAIAKHFKLIGEDNEQR